MIDSQTTETELAMEIGCRIVKTGLDSYQYQKIDGRGRTTAVAPAQAHAYELWTHFVRVAQQLGAAIEGGEDGDGAQPGKSPSPQVA